MQDHSTRRDIVKADLALIGVNAVWGMTFVTMKDLLVSVHPINILFWRFLIASLLLVSFTSFKTLTRTTIRHGSILGCVLFAGYAFQTYGLIYTTPARSGFITGLCVIMVPLISRLVLKTRLNRIIGLGIGCSFLGMILLTLNSGGSGNHLLRGDVLTLIGAFAYALQIVLVEGYIRQSETAALVMVEMTVVGLLSLAIGTAGGWINLDLTLSAFGQLLFLGVAATAIAFTVQKIAQKKTTAVHAALIFASEPVFAALFSSLLYQERFTPRLIAGCVLILAGIVIANTELRFYSPLSSSSIFKSNSKPST